MKEIKVQQAITIDYRNTSYVFSRQYEPLIKWIKLKGCELPLEVIADKSKYPILRFLVKPSALNSEISLLESTLGMYAQLLDYSKGEKFDFMNKEYEIEYLLTEGGTQIIIGDYSEVAKPDEVFNLTASNLWATLKREKRLSANPQYADLSKDTEHLKLNGTFLTNPSKVTYSRLVDSLASICINGRHIVIDRLISRTPAQNFIKHPFKIEKFEY